MGAIHVYDNNYQYIGNIPYTHLLPVFTKEELIDIIIRHFPHLKRKKCYLFFS